MRKLLVAFALVALGGSARAAATATNNLTVNVTVVSACTIDAPVLAFNNYNGALNQKTATLTVTCNTSNAPFTVTMGQGLHWDATGTGFRQVSNGTDTIRYDMYTDSYGGTPWVGAQTSAGSTNLATTPPTGTLTIYGQIAAGIVLPATDAGTTYSDTVVMTVTF
jgi:spore coat protein U-like protein